ncbi:hypothetical protein [Methylobacterium sp. SD21]|uniref:hypothetical protein n=1 Tax=Methylobacterium litchii TaxID=3138810 RepID=UPI00313D0F50
MNVVAENHADTLARRGGHSRDALVAAVIGERLRETFARERNELPEALAALLRSLDTARRDHATIT